MGRTSPLFSQCASGANWDKKLKTPDLQIWQKIISFTTIPKRGFSLPFALLKNEFDGSNKRKLIRVDTYEGAMAWHPDNEHILYLGTEADPNNPEEKLKGVYSVSIRSRERKLIYQDPEFRGHMALSPDGKHLVLVSKDSKEKRELYIVGFDGKNRRQLVKSDNSIWCPVFTPDSKEIIYTLEVKRDGKTIRNSVMAVPFEGGKPREIYASENPQDYFGTYSSSWLRDGRFVFNIRSNPGGTFHCALSLDGKSEPVKLSYKKGAYFSISPDGTRAVFQNGKYGTKLWLMSDFLPKDELAEK